MNDLANQVKELNLQAILSILFVNTHPGISWEEGFMATPAPAPPPATPPASAGATTAATTSADTPKPSFGKKAAGWALFVLVFLFVGGMTLGTVRSYNFSATEEGAKADADKLKLAAELVRANIKAQEVLNEGDRIRLEKERVALERDKLNQGKD